MRHLEASTQDKNNSLNNADQKSLSCTPQATAAALFSSIGWKTVRALEKKNSTCCISTYSSPQWMQYLSSLLFISSAKTRNVLKITNLLFIELSSKAILGSNLLWKSVFPAADFQFVPVKLWSVFSKETLPEIDLGANTLITVLNFLLPFHENLLWGNSFVNCLQILLELSYLHPLLWISRCYFQLTTFTILPLAKSITSLDFWL